MKNQRYFYIVVLALTVMLSVVLPALSQDTDTTKAVPETAKAEKDLSMYGEVKAVNTDANSISVQYYDYDNDEEKTTDIVLNKDTRMEGVSAMKDIAKVDWVDVVYEVIDGKNIAKSIIVEKEEVETVREEEAPKAVEPKAASAE